VVPAFISSVKPNNKQIRLRQSYVKITTIWGDFKDCWKMNLAFGHAGIMSKSSDACCTPGKAKIIEIV
jgi:hypothetical protein